MLWYSHLIYRCVVVAGVISRVGIWFPTCSCGKILSMIIFYHYTFISRAYLSTWDAKSIVWETWWWPEVGSIPQGRGYSSLISVGTCLCKGQSESIHIPSFTNWGTNQHFLMKNHSIQKHWKEHNLVQICKKRPLIYIYIQRHEGDQNHNPCLQHIPVPFLY